LPRKIVLTGESLQRQWCKASRRCCPTSSGWKWALLNEKAFADAWFWIFL